MIDIGIIYQLYIEVLQDKVDRLTVDLNTYKENKDTYLEFINNKSIAIKSTCSHSITDIQKSTNSDDIKFSPFYYHNGKKQPTTVIKMYVDNYVKYNNLYKKTRSNIKVLKRTIISKKLYNLIISKFNSKVVDKIVYDNHVFNYDKAFGSISILQKTIANPNIDWGKSDKKKQEILDRGGIPYYKKDAENNPNYKGEKWLVKRPQTDFFIAWHTLYTIKKYNPVIKEFTFIPARGKTSFVTKLGNVKKDRQRAFALYTRTKHTQDV